MQEKFKKIARFWIFMGVFHTIFAFSSIHAEALYFMPYEQKPALDAPKNAFANAKDEIKISIYSFTNNEIAKVLRDSARRGVKIHIIYDKESNVKNSASTIGYLAKYNNISVCLLSGLRAKNGKYYGIMHQKMAIVDSQTLILGSANWSKNAFENNFETLLFTQDQSMVQKALSAYAQMMSTCAGF